MLVVVMIIMVLAIALVLVWYTWRMFGSFRREEQAEERLNTDSLDVLIEAQAELESGVDKLTRELDLIKAGRGRR